MGRNNRVLMAIVAVFLMIPSVNTVHAQDWTKGEIIANAFKETKAIMVNDPLVSDKNVICLDVRTKDEFMTGNIPGSIHLQRGFLELKIENVIPDKNRKIIAYCKAGTRSALATLTLIKMGYKNVYYLEGGYTAWLKATCP
ncbi:MAG: hypothetical protein KKE61_13085, partial [Proteobacteria bacterium]|nr:hypothetical protein [Pseudomonadota bacterium]